MTVRRRLSEIFGGKGYVAAFLNSAGFIWLSGAAALLFWAFKSDFAGFVFFLSALTLILLFCEDCTPAIMVFAFIFFVFSDKNISFAGKEKWIFFAIAPMTAAIINVFRFKNTGFLLKGFSFSILVCFFPWLLQGLGVEDRGLEGFFPCAALALLFLIVYFALNAVSRRGGKQLQEYVARVLLVAGIIVFLQILIYRLSERDYKFEDSFVNLGWGTRNPVATMSAFCIPPCFYFSTKKSKFSFLFLILAFTEVFSVVLLASRGVVLVLAAALPFLMIFSVVKAENKVPNAAINLLFVITAVSIFIFDYGYIKKVFNRFFLSGLDDSGRAELQAAGIENFLRYPCFGIGFDYKEPLYNDCVNTTGPTYYHSTFVQIIACLGIFGAVCYVYMYYWRYRVALTDFSPVKFVLLLSMLILEGYGLFDTVYFQPLEYYLMLVVTLSMEKELEKSRALPAVLKLAKAFKRNPRLARFRSEGS